MMNFFVASPQLYSVYLASLIQKHYGFKPVFFYRSKSSEEKLKALYPDVMSQDYLSACKGNQVNSVFQNNLNLSFSDIQFLKKYQTIALHMMERNDSNAQDFSFLSRENFYFQQATYFKNLLLYLKVDLVLFEEEPHQANDYILYLVAKLLDCRVVMGVRSIAQLGIIYKSDWEDTTSYIKIEQKHSNNISASQLLGELDPDLRSYYNKLRGSYDEVLKAHLWDQVDRLNFKNDVKNKRFTKKLMNSLSSYSLLLGKLSKLPKLIPQFETDQKVRGKRVMDSRQSYLSFRFQKFRTIKLKKHLEKYYLQRAKKLENYSDQRFVIFALQYQPEKSTCPLAGIFVNQKLILECLLASLPKDVKIVVREHPSQFVVDYTRYGECYRSEHFYDEIIQDDRVIFSDLGDDIFDIIDSSIGICSAGGTILWEARLRGKIGFNFAYSWFNALDNIYHIKDQEDLDLAISKMLDEKPLSEVACLQFLKAFCEQSQHAAIGGPPQLEYFSLTPQENANNHFLALKRFFERG